jgi:ubiquinone/menaquinone biosynthesis C-methylase UbiE
LPFLDGAFDLVTVRIAPHHYADIQAAVREMARVLVNGGRLVVIDNIAPEDSALDAAMNDWERLRDPSHVRAYTAMEWRAFVEAAGLRLTQSETARKTHAFAPWVERMRMPAEARASLEADMVAAPASAREAFAVVVADGRVQSWSSDFMLLRAQKEA